MTKEINSNVGSPQVHRLAVYHDLWLKKKDLAEFSFLIIKRIQMTTAQRSKTDNGIM